ncbi:MAG TPA: right-handed parallel beta-helix repeat-containing protein [Calditrichia bacterium]|nr:right-handed parallel beta-helix repeat-containing protein [Calditrichia bacterium]
MGILLNKTGFAAITAAFFLLLSTAGMSILAQPSGGPYGPLSQSYALPKVPGTIYYAAPQGNPEGPGKSADAPTTVEAAISRVKSGDAIVLRGGTYRTGNLLLNQGITLQPYQNEKVVFKGTYVASDWTDIGNGLWTTTWQHLFPQKPQSWWRRHRQGKFTPQWLFNNDMLFIDGKFLQAAGWEGYVDENSYFIDYESGTVYIGTDPTDRLVEITAFDVALQRTTGKAHGKKSDKKGPKIYGITFTQYAYRAIEIEGTEPEGLSAEKDHGKDVVGTTLEHCEISYCSRVAGYFRGDSLVIRHCKISDTSTEGLYIIASNDVLLERNILTRNNIEGITGYYPAAVKIFNQSYRVTCNDNLVIDHPNSNGIWYDVGNVDGVFTNNWIQNIGHNRDAGLTDQVWPSDNGFFFEISRGALCAGNLFVDCDHGVLVLNASDVHIYNNTFANSQVAVGRNTRSAQGDHFGWHPSTGPDVDERDGHIFANNLMSGDARFFRPLFFTWQTPSLCEQLPDPMFSEVSHNIYFRQMEKTPYPVILWSPGQGENCQSGFADLEAFRKRYPAFGEGSRFYDHSSGPLFQSPELGHYQPTAGFPEPTGFRLPPEAGKLLGISGRFAGAFAPREKE